MKRYRPLLFPGILLVGLLAVLWTPLESPEWVTQPLFGYLPYVVLAIAALCGLAFNQTRVSFIAIVWGGAAYLVDHWSGAGGDPARAHGAAVTATVLAPWLTAGFYRQTERGLLTVHGGMAAATVVSAALILALLPAIPEFSRGVSNPGVWLRPVSPSLRLPVAGLLVCLGAAPFLFVRKEHESPSLGPLLAMGLVFLIVAVSWRRQAWTLCPYHDHLVLVSFCTGAGVALTFAVIEGLWRNAVLDELTELPGRRAMKQHFNRLGSSFVIAVADIDFFKKVNDQFGHDAGDQVLRYVAKVLGRSRVCKAYRFGGEEFVLVADGRELAEVAADLEDMRAAIEGRELGIRGKHRPRRKPESPSSRTKPIKVERMRVTASFGAAASWGPLSFPHDVLKAADQELYRAKQSGRNRVCLAAS